MTSERSPLILAVHPDDSRPDRTAALAAAADDAAAVRRGSVSIVEGDGEGPPALPALTLRRAGRDAVHWLAVPVGPEAAPFLAALERFGAAAPTRSEGSPVGARIDVFVAAACPNCPRAVDAALRVAADDPSVTVAVIDAQAFPELAEAIPVRSVPTTIVDGGATFVGEVTPGRIAAAVAARGGPGQVGPVLASLVDAGRLEAAGRWIAEHRAGRAFAELWREAAMEARIGLTLVAEHALEAHSDALGDAVPGLVELLDTPDAPRRGDTVDLLARIAHPDSREALALLRTDPDPDIAEAAAEAVEAIDSREDPSAP